MKGIIYVHKIILCSENFLYQSSWVDSFRGEKNYSPIDVSCCVEKEISYINDRFRLSFIETIYKQWIIVQVGRFELISNFSVLWQSVAKIFAYFLLNELNFIKWKISWFSWPMLITEWSDQTEISTRGGFVSMMRALIELIA